MKIPHEFEPGGWQHQLVLVPGDPDQIRLCAVCDHVESSYQHQPPVNPLGLLGELFDFVVDNVSIGKIPAPPNGLLSRCSKVLSR